jgi:hypothetical protein
MRGPKLKYLNNILESNNYGKFEVLDFFYDIKKYKIKFLETGTERLVDTSNLSKGNVYDPYKPTYNNFGYLGKLYGIAKTHPMLSTWEKMIYRCAKQDTGYSLDLICPEWADFSVFCRDVEEIPFYSSRIKYGGFKWNLDKDILGSKYYSKNTCLWIPQEMNSQVGGIYKMIDIGFKIEYPTKENIIKYIESNYDLWIVRN